MRIAYLGQMADVSRETSIAKKIRSQCLAWTAAGHSVCYFALAPSLQVWPGLDPVEAELVASGNALARFFRTPALCKRIRAWQPDLIYLRYAHHSPGLGRLFRNIPTLAEINSDDTTEYALTLSYAKQLYHRFTRQRLLQSVSGLVPVTHELSHRFAAFSHPALVVANSIDLASFAPVPLPSPSDPPRMVFIGSAGAPWHGLDRIGELAALLPHVGIDIIGFHPADWHSTVSSPPPPNLLFHGPMDYPSYVPLLHHAVAALGTFGLFRKHMDEACPLKVREYLALGLPVIGACHDTDIPETSNYYLRLPNDAAPLRSQLPLITRFLAHWQTRRVPRSAIAHLDVSVKETRRLAFMSRIATPPPHLPAP